MIQTSEIEEYLEVCRKHKEIDEKKKKLTDKFKKEMIAAGQDTIIHNGSKISLTKSSRASFKKNMKNPFLLLPKQKGLESCLKIEYDIDKRTLENEIAAGSISQNEVDNYMSFTDVNTLRVTL